MIKEFVRKIFYKAGFTLVKHKEVSFLQKDFFDAKTWELEIMNKVSDFTMLSHEKIFNLISGVQYIVKNNIEGAIVECGVARGGAMMSVAKTLKKLNVKDRELYLYDIFYPGMPPGCTYDKTADGENVNQLIKHAGIVYDKRNKIDIEQKCTLNGVKKLLSYSKYPKEKIFFIKGMVEDTIPNIIPEKVSILRLDTDFYKSTKHELEYLFPRLQRGGILIIDDYGVLEGSKKATDEYLQKKGISLFLNRVDNSGCRVGVKI